MTCLRDYLERTCYFPIRTNVSQHSFAAGGTRTGERSSMRTDAMQAALFTEQTGQKPIQVIGVGDAGCRAASEIWRRKIRGVGIICIDTDALSLDRSQSHLSMLLGAATMHGFGSGGDTRAVAAASMDRTQAIVEMVSDATCVVVIAGLTGGTGAGAAPVIAEAIRETGVLVIGIPITPLEFEPINTHLAAADSLARLRDACDGVQDIQRRSEERSEQTAGHAGIALHKMFSSDRDFIATFVAALATVGNSDPAKCDANSGDLRSILRDGASTVFGTGTGFGHTGAAEATQTCLDAAFQGFDRFQDLDRALVLIESGPDIPISHIATVTSLIEARIGTETELHTAVRRSRLLGSNIRVSIIGSLHETKRPGQVTPFRASNLSAFRPRKVDRVARHKFATQLAGRT